MSLWPKKFEYSRLNKDEDSEQCVEDGSQHVKASTRSSCRKDRLWVLYGLVVALALLNGLQWVKSHISMSQVDTGCSHYSKLPFDTRITYHKKTVYWGDNETLADQKWDALNADPVAIALSKEERTKYNLPPSAPFPWDNNKELYFVKAFHHIHCLRLLRRAFVDFERGLEQTVDSHHVHHCLDALRQDTMCKADDTPMPLSYEKGSVGDNQQMQCRNWDKLVAWTQDLERNACHKVPVNYKEPAHTLEQYAFCPKNSPYYPIMMAYFEKWGHKEELVV